ncbi:hypothetical protein [Streptomyces sp. NBC_01465]|uniref:hypothetical protein n=1 Tax=Streptomyces sp. NBC_01465 TaxID=2903878 RepID=UPI002E2ED229|nr:hypothetical protein [Streptomyces sp. NBC_01465]
MRRQAGIALAAVAASSLLLTTGCGGHSGSKADKPSASAGKSSAAAKQAASGEKAALTRKQLESAAIKSSDVATYEVTVPKSASGPIGGEHMVADKPACQPVADALSATAGAVKPVAAVERSAVAKNLSGVMVRVRLASYADGDADKVMSALSSAATTCKGFTGSVGTDKQHVAVADYDGYLTAQGSVTLRLTTKFGKQTLPVYLDVGTVGTTVEYFATFNVTGEDPTVGPTEVETPQTVKLTTAGH